MLQPLLALVFASAPAHASSLIDDWSYDSYTNGKTMVGVDGWTNGFTQDTWDGYYSTRSGGYYVLSMTDDNSGDYPGDWGSGGAIDNWLVNTNVSVEDGVLRVTAYDADDDSIGVVFRMVDSKNYYLLLLVLGGGDNPIGDSGPYTEIVRIKDGKATVLKSTTTTFVQSQLFSVELLADGANLRASIWQDTTTTWTDADDTISVTDTDPVTGLGAAGFYAYNAGGDPNAGETIAAFGNIDVLQIDEDDDGVADDTDNCETTANPDQADADHDGIGDLCDDTPGTDTGGTDTDTGSADSGTDTGTDTDTSTTDTDTASTDTDTASTDSGGDSSIGGTDDTGSTSTDTGIYVPKGSLTTCSCSSGPRSGLSWLGLAGLAILVTRRRK